MTSVPWLFLLLAKLEGSVRLPLLLFLEQLIQLRHKGADIFKLPID